MGYYAEACNDALEMVNNFLTEVSDQIIQTGEASRDLFNDFANGDGYHHENHVDKDYRLSNAADLLDELSEWEETDEGLWSGLEPRKAVSAQAAYTYGNCVLSRWQDLIDAINQGIEDMDNHLRFEAEDIDIECDERNDIIRAIVPSWHMVFSLHGEYNGAQRDESESGRLMSSLVERAYKDIWNPALAVNLSILADAFTDHMTGHTGESMAERLRGLYDALASSMAAFRASVEAERDAQANSES